MWRTREQYLVAAVFVGWIGLTAVAGSALAAPRIGRSLPLGQSQSGASQALPGDLDERSGLTISVGSDRSGKASVRASGHGLEVTKTVASDGTFVLNISGAGDQLTLATMTGGFSVERGGMREHVSFARQGASPSFGRAAAVLAGSPALRMYRGAVAHLGDEARRSVGGTALEIGDVLLRILQDDPGAVDRLTHGRSAAGSRIIRAGWPMRPCYADWEQEVTEALNAYEACYYDFSWWSGGREVCAFAYLLRVEAAWFQFLTCVGFRAQ